MDVFTELLPERKSSRRSAIKWKPSADPYGPTAGYLTIETGRTGCLYRVAEFPPGWDGRGFTLTKITPGTDSESDSYSCFVARNGQDKSCECRGFLAHGHCKHLDSLAALIANGWL